MGIFWGGSRWGRKAAAAYLLLLAATAGYLTYHALFNRSRFIFPGTLLLTLGLPWTRTMGNGAGWLGLIVSLSVNTGLLYFLGSRFERLARGERL